MASKNDEDDSELKLLIDSLSVLLFLNILFKEKFK